MENAIVFDRWKKRCVSPPRTPPPVVLGEEFTGEYADTPEPDPWWDRQLRTNMPGMDFSRRHKRIPAHPGRD